MLGRTGPNHLYPTRSGVTLHSTPRSPESRPSWFVVLAASYKRYMLLFSDAPLFRKPVVTPLQLRLRAASVIATLTKNNPPAQVRWCEVCSLSLLTSFVLSFPLRLDSFVVV